MYLSVDMPQSHRYKVFENNTTESLELVVAVDTDAGYIVYYKRHDHDKKIVCAYVHGSKTWVPLPFIKWGNFRLEKRSDADV